MRKVRGFLLMFAAVFCIACGGDDKGSSGDGDGDGDGDATTCAGLCMTGSFTGGENMDFRPGATLVECLCSGDGVSPGVSQTNCATFCGTFEFASTPLLSMQNQTYPDKCVCDGTAADN